MAGQSVLNPTHIHPLASPASSYSSLSSFPDSPFWDCELLQPPSRTASAATSLPAPSPFSLSLDPHPSSPTCDLRKRLMNILNLTTEPSSTLPQVSITSYDPYAHASPAPHRPTYPRTSTMLSPLTPAYTHKITVSRPSLPSPLPAMSFAAPAPRFPLASVLRHLDASWAPISPAASASAPTYAHDATQGPERGPELPQLGLGLMMGMDGLPIYIPRARLDPESPSQSQSRYSRRLRSIAPAPLQLASATLTFTPTTGTPLRTVQNAAAQTPPAPSFVHRAASPSWDPFVDVPLATAKRAPAFSVSPQSDQRASESSMIASQSTAPTSLVFPGESENVHPGRSTNPSYVDRLSWQRSPDSPLSPFSKSARAGPSTARRATFDLKTPTYRSSFVPEDPLSPARPMFPAPPPLIRTGFVPLPDMTGDDLHTPDSQYMSPLHADLRLDLGVEDLTLRAEQCSETIARASLSLCSCSLLRDPDAIKDLCDRLRATFLSVQCALDGTPSEFSADGLDAKRMWYAKHWQVVSSLDRNLNLFYLLARQIEQRPPRIHRLASLLDKLSTYQVKFADLARRIVLSHEKFRFLGLRAQLSSRAPAAKEDHVLRHDARAMRQEGRARRREIREEITRVRGRMRSIRERDFEADVAPDDADMAMCNEEEDGGRRGCVEKDTLRAMGGAGREMRR